MARQQEKCIGPENAISNHFTTITFGVNANGTMLRAHRVVYNSFYILFHCRGIILLSTETQNTLSLNERYHPSL